VIKRTRNCSSTTVFSMVVERARSPQSPPAKPRVIASAAPATAPAPAPADWPEYVEAAYCATDRWALLIAAFNL
jgi:cell division septation protein DedD